jgi:hypothetical protein
MFKHLKALVIIVLVGRLVDPASLTAQSQASIISSDHVVSLTEMKTALKTMSSARERNIAEVQKLFRNEEFRRQVAALANLEKIEKAVPTLDDKTLEKLAAESRNVDDQIRGGSPWKWVFIAAVAVAVTFAILCSTNSNGGCIGG